jgi:hypothetical protein
MIALLNCQSKVLEKIIATRLSYLANSGKGLLHSSQLGGRKQRSAVDTVLLLQHYVQQEKNRCKTAITTTIFLDIKGAFDHVSKKQLLQILRTLKAPDNLVRWVDSFCTGRKIQLAFEG